MIPDQGGIKTYSFNYRQQKYCNFNIRNPFSLTCIPLQPVYFNWLYSLKAGNFTYQMGKENIEKYSKRYALLKSAAGFWHNNVFYRKVIVIGQENIDPENHLIFAPNHQNALMDALAVLFTHRGQPVFLARADIFKRKSIASILYFLKILPVFRIRDGFSSLKGNDEIFNKTIDVLKNKNGLIILPEGDHLGFRRLRQLKKGICRVAFQAEEAEDFKLKIKIIPVGLEFSQYNRYRQVLDCCLRKAYRSIRVL